MSHPVSKTLDQIRDPYLFFFSILFFSLFSFFTNAALYWKDTVFSDRPKLVGCLPYLHNLDNINELIVDS